MSVNPLQREGGYWKPVLDYEHWEDATSQSSAPASSAGPVLTQPAVRHDLCHKCGAEFVVDSPYCRMCGTAREGSDHRAKNHGWLDFYQLRRKLGLTVGATLCLVVGLICIGGGLATGFIYTANTLVDWQAIQAWRAEWLLAAGVSFVCGILLNGRKLTHH
jgi:ribosomal protein L40E